MEYFVGLQCRTGIGSHVSRVAGGRGSEKGIELRNMGVVRGMPPPVRGLWKAAGGREGSCFGWQWATARGGVAVFGPTVEWLGRRRRIGRRIAGTDLDAGVPSVSSEYHFMMEALAKRRRAPIYRRINGPWSAAVCRYDPGDHAGPGTGDVEGSVLP